MQGEPPGGGDPRVVRVRDEGGVHGPPPAVGPEPLDDAAGGRVDGQGDGLAAGAREGVVDDDVDCLVAVSGSVLGENDGSARRGGWVPRSKCGRAVSKE